MHWTRRVGLLCLCLLPIGWATIGDAQDAITTPANGVVFLDDFSGSMALTEDGGSYLLFHKMIGDGVGFSHGYSRLGLRAKLWEDFDRHFFTEVHAMITDDSKAGANVGLGYRWLYDGGVAGLHTWYDNIESSAGHRYQQIAFGAEYLHPSFDIRANGYVPFDSRENFLGVVDPGDVPRFLGSTIGTDGIGLFERAMHGFDLEVGTPVPVVKWLRMYAGTYWLGSQNGGDATGFRGRAEARIAQGVNLNFIVTEDNRFGTNVNMDVEVRWGRRGLPTRFIRDYAALDRRYDQVRRTWPVHLSRERDDVFVPLIRPETGGEYSIVWVNNTAGPGGDGSFENPFNMLPDRAEGADLILVRRGVGNTVGNIALEANQQLLGEGKAHFINTDRLGLIQLPDEFRSTGAFPTLVSGAGAEPIVRLSDNNVVSAFTLLGVNGIAGPASGVNINDFRLDSLRGTIVNGINIGDASGLGIIQDVDFTVLPGGTGIQVANVTGDPLTLLAQNIRTSGGGTGMSIAAAGSDVVFGLEDFRATGHASAGLVLSATNSDLTGGVIDAFSSNNGGTGVVVNAQNGTGTLVFENLAADNNGVDGMRIVATGGSELDIAILDSSLSGNADDNLQTNVTNSSTVNLFVDPTALDNAGEHAFEFLVSNNSTLNAIFADVSMTGSGSDAVNGRVQSGSTGLLNFFNVDATGSGRNGLNVTTTGSSSLLAVFEDVDFSGSGDSGMIFDVINNSQAVLLAENVTSSNNGMIGLEVDVRSGAAGPSFFTGVLENSFFNDNGSSGVVVDVTGVDSVAILDFVNTPVTGNGDDGLQFSAVNGGTFLATALGPGNDFSNNAGSAFQGLVNGPGSLAVLTVEDAPADNSGDAGGIFIADNGGMLQFNYTNGSLIDSGREGLFVAASNSGMAEINLDNVIVAGSQETGIDFHALAGGEVVLNMTGGFVFGNGQGAGDFSGVRGEIAGNGSSAIVTFDGTTVDFNTSHGFEFDVSGGGFLLADLIGSPENGPMSISNNGGHGILLNAAGANTEAILRTIGEVDINANQLNGIFGNANGAALFVADIGGNVNGNVTGHGVQFNLNNVALGALHLRGNVGKSINGNGGDGVNINVANSVLGEVDVNGQIANGLVVDGYDISGNAGAGVRITTVNTVVADDNFRINHVFATNNLGGGGVEITMTDSAADGLSITNSGMAFNNGHGILLDLTRTPIDGLRIEDNNFGQGIDLGLNFNLAGNTNLSPFVLQNTSGLAFDLTSFQLDLDGTPVIWDTEAPGRAVPFQPTGDPNFFGFPSDLLTGLETVNGIEILPGTNPLQDINGNVLPDGGVEDGSTLLALTFLDFNSGEQLRWRVGNSLEDDPARTVNGSLYDGAVVRAEFSGGYQLTGHMVAVPGTNTATFVPMQTSPGVFGQGIIGNAGHGILINANDSDLTNMSIQRNELIQNGLSGLTINASNGTRLSGNIVDNAILNNGTDGLRINLQNASLDGLNINNNIIDGTVTGEGIYIGNPGPQANQTINLAVTDNVVNGAGGRGIHMDFNGLIALNLLVQNNAVTNSGGDGIAIDVINPAAVAPGTNGVFLLDNNVSNSGGNGIAANFVNMGLNNFIADNNNVAESGINGFLLSANNSPINNVQFTGNFLEVTGTGDALQILMVDSAVDTMTILNGGYRRAAGHGLNIDLTRSPIGSLEIGGNEQASSGQFIGLNFAISGNKNTNNFYSISNTSSAGIDVTAFTFNIGTSDGDLLNANPNNGIIWDTQTGAPGTNPFQPFLPAFFTDVFTGLSAIGTNQFNAVAVEGPITQIGATDQTQDNLGTILDGGGIPNGTAGNRPQIYLGFDDFNPGETFIWQIDSDLINLANNATLTQTVLGHWFNNSTVRVDYSDGRILTGIMQQDPNNPQGSVFVITGGSATFAGGFGDNGANGILINAQDNSNIGNLLINQNLIDNNANHGIEFRVTDSTLPGPGAPGVISNNTIINQQTGDGIRMINPDTNGAPIGMNFVSNEIADNNAGHGINISVNNNAGQFNGTFNTNQINSNGLSGVRVETRQNAVSNLAFDGNGISGNGNIGVNLVGRETSTTNVGFGQNGAIAQPNVITGNTGGGVQMQLFNTAQGNFAIENSTVSGNIGDGLRLITNDSSRMTSPVIGGADAANRNTQFSGNTGRGVFLQANQTSRMTAPTIRNSIIDGNASHGIEVARFSDALLDDVLIDGNIISNNTAGDGIRVDLQGGAINVDTLAALTIDVTASNNQIEANGGHGIHLRLDGDARLNADLVNNTILDSRFGGIFAETFLDARLDGDWSNNIIRNSASLIDVADGISISATQRSEVGNNGGLTIELSEISGFTRDGIRIETSNSEPPVLNRPLVNVLIQDNEPQDVADTRGIFNNGGSGVNLISTAGILGAVLVDNHIHDNEVDGIAAAKSGIAQLTLFAADNLVEMNQQHGVNLTTSGTSSLGAGNLTATLIDNQILRNARRGVSLVNTGDADSVLTIAGTVNPVPSQGVNATSRIEQNGEVGVYIENSTEALFTNGNFTDNDITFTLQDTAVIGNGTNTGVTPDNRNGVWIRVGTSLSGAVNATVDRNVLTGNGNVDFATESFSSISQATLVAGGVFSQYPNTPGVHVPDPLARLGLVFTNNRLSTLDVTRFGATYNNSDQWKSPAWVFRNNGNTRVRNAQRAVSGAHIIHVTDVESAASATTFVGTAAPVPNLTLAGLGISVGGNIRGINTYTVGTRTYNVVNALPGTPAVGTPITVFANQLSGIGQSTFRTSFGTAAAGGNVIVNPGGNISDFNNSVLLPPGNDFFGIPEFGTSFNWTILANPFW